MRWMTSAAPQRSTRNESASNSSTMSSHDHVLSQRHARIGSEQVFYRKGAKRRLSRGAQSILRGRQVRPRSTAASAQKLWVSCLRSVALLQVGATMMRRMVHRGPLGSIGPANWNAARYPDRSSFGNAAQVQRPYG